MPIAADVSSEICQACSLAAQMLTTMLQLSLSHSCPLAALWGCFGPPVFLPFNAALQLPTAPFQYCLFKAALQLPTAACQCCASATFSCLQIGLLALLQAWICWNRRGGGTTFSRAGAMSIMALQSTPATCHSLSGVCLGCTVSTTPSSMLKPSRQKQKKRPPSE